MPKLGGDEGMGRWIRSSCFSWSHFPKCHLSPIFIILINQRCNILHEGAKMMKKRSKQWGSKGQGKVLRPYNRMSQCAPPFMYPLFIVPPTRVVGWELPCAQACPSCENLAVHLHECEPAFPKLPPKLPLYPVALTLWPQIPSGSAPASDSIPFSHYSVVTWASLLFLKRADHVPVSAFTLAVHYALNVFFPDVFMLPHFLSSLSSHVTFSERPSWPP